LKGISKNLKLSFITNFIIANSIKTQKKIAHLLSTSAKLFASSLAYNILESKFLVNDSESDSFKIELNKINIEGIPKSFIIIGNSVLFNKAKIITQIW